MTNGYDVIGDVHGSATKLEALLHQLGYTHDGSSWRHPERTAVFVGDLIDRGDRQLDVVDIARRMVDHGHAHVMMGNHEFNAIAWATEHPDRPGAYLRQRTDKNRSQHAEFLKQVEEPPGKHRELIDWFRTLPMWLDLDGLRVVHACWHEPSQQDVGQRLDEGNTVLVAASERGTAEHRAIEWLLKGPEIPLPEGFAYLDKGGHLRRHARFRWWDPTATTLRRGALIPPGTSGDDGKPLAELPDEPHGHDHLPTYTDTVPLVVGHYWETGTPTPLARHVACVDYSAVKGGPLVAYRWTRGETEIHAANFVAAN